MRHVCCSSPSSCFSCLWPQSILFFSGACVCMYSLTAVDSLDARVISRLPFMPNTAGTRMKISVTSRNTSQFWNTKQRILLTTESIVHTMIDSNCSAVNLFIKLLPVHLFFFLLRMTGKSSHLKTWPPFTQFPPHLDQLKQNPSWHRPEPSQQKWHQDLKYQRANCLHWCTWVTSVFCPCRSTGSWCTIKFDWE